MTLDLDRAHRRESAGTNMQRHRRGADARVGQRFEDVVGEMQPRSGRRDRAGLRRIHGLVVVDVGGTDGAMYIMRQRERAVAIQYLFDRNFAFSYDDWASGPRIARNSERVTVAQDEARIVLEHAMRPNQREPCARGTFSRTGRPHHQQLDAAARLLLREQPRRQHARVVQHDQIALAQMTHEFVEARMIDRLGFAIEHEQARLVAASQRLLRNQFFGQFVVEFGKPHLRGKRSPRAKADRANSATPLDYTGKRRARDRLRCASPRRDDLEWIIDTREDGGALRRPIRCRRIRPRTAPRFREIQCRRPDAVPRTDCSPSYARRVPLRRTAPARVFREYRKCLCPTPACAPRGSSRTDCCR